MTTRRHFMSQTAAAASAMSFPLIAGAQAKAVKVGVLHPVTGALAYSGQQCRMGALMAIEDINKAGGIKSLGGAKIEAMLGDAQSSPQAGTAEIEKMNEAGVCAVVGAFASAICLATTQAAAKYNLPHVVDVGVADQIVERGLKNTFRFGPGYRKCAEVAVANLHVLNTAAGKPARTVMIIHEESLFGTGTANLLSKELPGYGYDVKEVIKHANPTRNVRVDLLDAQCNVVEIAGGVGVLDHFFHVVAITWQLFRQQVGSAGTKQRLFVNDHHRASGLASCCIEHMQIGHRHFSTLSVAWAKAKRVFQATLHNLIGHAHVHHVRQVVLGCRLRGSQTNGRSKRTHHRANTGFVHLLNFGRAGLGT